MGILSKIGSWQNKVASLDANGIDLKQGKKGVLKDLAIKAGVGLTRKAWHASGASGNAAISGAAGVLGKGVGGAAARAHAAENGGSAGPVVQNTRTPSIGEGLAPRQAPPLALPAPNPKLGQPRDPQGRYLTNKQPPSHSGQQSLANTVAATTKAENSITAAQDRTRALNSERNQSGMAEDIHEMLGIMKSDGSSPFKKDKPGQEAGGGLLSTLAGLIPGAGGLLGKVLGAGKKVLGAGARLAGKGIAKAAPLVGKLAGAAGKGIAKAAPAVATVGGKLVGAAGKGMKAMAPLAASVGGKIAKLGVGAAGMLGVKSLADAAVPAAEVAGKVGVDAAKAGTEVAKVGVDAAKAGAGAAEIVGKGGEVVAKEGLAGAKAVGGVTDVVAKPAATVAAAGAETGVKEGAKVAGKFGAKSLIKKIPLIGALAGLGFGASRAMDGDWTGAGMEVASGVAGIVPGIGTAASLGIDGALLARDMGVMPGMEAPGTVGPDGVVKPVPEVAVTPEEKAAKEKSAQVLAAAQGVAPNAEIAKRYEAEQARLRAAPAQPVPAVAARPDVVIDAPKAPMAPTRSPMPMAPPVAGFTTRREDSQDVENTLAGQPVTKKPVRYQLNKDIPDLLQSVPQSELSQSDGEDDNTDQARVISLLDTMCTAMFDKDQGIYVKLAEQDVFSRNDGQLQPGQGGQQVPGGQGQPQPQGATPGKPAQNMAPATPGNGYTNEPKPVGDIADTVRQADAKYRADLAIRQAQSSSKPRPRPDGITGNRPGAVGGVGPGLDPSVTGPGPQVAGAPAKPGAGGVQPVEQKKWWNAAGDKVSSWTGGRVNFGTSQTKPGAVGAVPAAKGPYDGASPQVAQDALNRELFAQAEKSTGKVGYKMGSKNLSSGSIDCSGWIENINKTALGALGEQAPGVDTKAMGKKIFNGNGAAGIVKNLEDNGAEVITKENLTADKLKEGMIIGENNGGSWAKDRHRGIDHVTQVVKDPETGQLMVSQSQGGKGVTMTPADKYLEQKKKSSKNQGLFAVDPTQAYDKMSGGQYTAQVGRDKTTEDQRVGGALAASQGAVDAKKSQPQVVIASAPAPVTAQVKTAGSAAGQGTRTSQVRNNESSIRRATDNMISTTMS